MSTNTSLNTGLVVKSNQLIEASYRLSLTEQRLVSYAVMMAREGEKGLLTEHLEITAKQFAIAFDIDEQNAYGQLKEAVAALFNRFLTVRDIHTTSGCERVSKIRWISRGSYIDGAGAVQLMFGQDIVPHITRLEKGFTSYRLEKIGNLSSAHAVHLYELMAQYLAAGKREIEIEWLKNAMQLNDDYPRVFDLKKNVIDLAIKQINEHTDIAVSYTQKKLGRVITHFVFEIKRKPAPKVKKAKLPPPAPSQLPESVTQIVVKNSDSEIVKSARAEALAAVRGHSRGFIPT